VGPDRLGWDYSIEDRELLEYRDKKLKLGRTKVIIVSGSGNLNLRLRVFNSSKVEPWIVTTKAGAKILESQMEEHWKGTPLKVISIGENNPIDLKKMMLSLRKEYGIRTLLCEGGPNFYGQLLGLKLVDEDFRTIATQVLGESTQANIERPTAYGQVSYMPETAPWFRIISVHCSPPYHIFLRLRYEGPREFGD
jgi:riboflavin biosynthesis pyrimidine reductase